MNAALAQTEFSGTEETQCAPPGIWTVPGGGILSSSESIEGAAKSSVVLLGEMHDNVDHHRWQLHTLAALHAFRPNIVIGFEMFPRRVQNVLDKWVAGDLSEAEFLAASDWNEVWSTDASLYLPLFHFARMNRVPMVALNIDKPLRRAVSSKGFLNVPENEREGVVVPAAPSAAYLGYLLPIYGEHKRHGKSKGSVSLDDPDFLRFVESQQLWDGAMAQAIYSALHRPGKPLVIGIMGSGHIRHGHGVPHQLKDMGVSDISALLPWDSGKHCEQIVAGVADVIFGIDASPVMLPLSPKPRLGIRFELERDGAHVLEVEKQSIAAAAGIRDNDTITEAAGIPIMKTSDIIEIVRRQAPGTLLPLKVKRDSEIVEMNARFPAEPK